MIYVLITPVRNEEAFIEKTLKSVVAQTVLPKKWIVVSDGSTDGTDEIINKYAKNHTWIEFIKFAGKNDRNFARKVHCFNIGYSRINNIYYDVIGNLDGDVSFEKDYFEYILDKFEKNIELGVAGTPYLEGKYHSFNGSYANINHVHGAIQMFRRECFDEIGGYKPIKEGGIDWIAVTTARMKGWKTYSFQDKVYVHHRKIGTGNNSVLLSRFNYGKKDYFLGGHPAWQLLRSVFQMRGKPYIIGGFFILLGYSWSFVTRVKRPISDDLKVFHRKEQMKRMSTLFSGKFGIIHFFRNQ